MTGARAIGRRRRVAASVTRTILTAVVLLVIYYRAPLDRPVDFRIVVWLAVGLITLGAAVGWQARAIAVSDMPRVRALETAAVGLTVLLILYASAYVVMSHAEPGSFTEVLGRTDGLYYTMTVFATVGFGDITPVAEPARVLVTIQMVANLLVLGLVVRSMLEAVRRGQSRQGRTPPA
jgi:CDP-diglyceride synthetase